MILTYQGNVMLLFLIKKLWNCSMCKKTFTKVIDTVNI